MKYWNGRPDVGGRTWRPHGIVCYQALKFPRPNILQDLRLWRGCVCHLKFRRKSNLICKYIKIYCRTKRERICINKSGNLNDIIDIIDIVSIIIALLLINYILYYMFHTSSVRIQPEIFLWKSNIIKAQVVYFPLHRRQKSFSGSVRATGERTKSSEFVFVCFLFFHQTMCVNYSFITLRRVRCIITTI